MGDYKETAVYIIPKEQFANLKEDSGFVEHIVKHLSSELAERIMGILEREEEIIVRQSDLRVSEFMPTKFVEYRRQINWNSLVRCKDCKHHEDEGVGMVFCPHMIGAWVRDDWFCGDGERKEDETEDVSDAVSDSEV